MKANKTQGYYYIKYTTSALRVIAWVILVIGVIGSLVLGITLGGIKGGGLIVIGIIGSFLAWLVVFAAKELLTLFMDVKENTGNTAEHITYIKTKGMDEEIEKAWEPTIAGILSIIAGVINMIWGIVAAVLWGKGDAFMGIEWLNVIVIALAIFFGIIAIVGGIYAIKRRIWELALAGPICALVGPAGMLGIPAIIFVMLGNGEFK
ncbi:MAG: hypothetical protein MUO61_05510 [Dehalococcoidia bacterium]|nr:hypothetical protein [Dehalococcoidia bacterium]